MPPGSGSGPTFLTFSLPLKGEYSTPFHFQTPRIRRPDWGVLGGHAFNLDELTFVPRPPPWTRFPPSPYVFGRTRWADAASPSGSGGGSYPGWLAPGTCVLLSRSHACYSKQPIR